MTTQTIDSHTHIRWMLSHYYTIILIQIKHGVFDCKVRNQKRNAKVGFFRTDTKNLPGEDHKESTYRAIVYLLSILSGTEVQAEHHSYKGRSDLEVLTPDFIYIFEFKYNRSVSEAMEQIKSRDYAGRYHLDPRTIYLIAANFIENKDSRGLSYEIQQFK